MTSGRLATLVAAHKTLQILAEELGRDAPLNRALVLFRIAQAGAVGMDQGKLQDELEMSSAGISRIVQALSAVSYQKDRDGKNLIVRVFDASDNRKRTLKLTPDGERVVSKIIGALGGR